MLELVFVVKPFVVFLFFLFLVPFFGFIVFVPIVVLLRAFVGDGVGIAARVGVKFHQLGDFGLRLYVELLEDLGTPSPGKAIWVYRSYEGRVRSYFYAPVVEEARGLQHSRMINKPDHAPGGSKDVLDAMCGVVNGLEATFMRSNREVDIEMQVF